MILDDALVAPVIFQTYYFICKVIFHSNWRQSGIFGAMWPESTPNPVPLILLIVWAWPTLFIGVEPTVSQEANES